MIEKKFCPHCKMEKLVYDFPIIGKRTEPVLRYGDKCYQCRWALRKAKQPKVSNSDVNWRHQSQFVGKNDDKNELDEPRTRKINKTTNCLA